MFFRYTITSNLLYNDTFFQLIRKYYMKSKLLPISILSIFMAGNAWAAPMPVVSSFSILGDVAKQIGGERVTVNNLVGADGDAHAYQLSSKDVQKLSSAKLILINGLGLENGELVRAVKNSKVPYAEATKGISALNQSHSHGDHHHHGSDPHVWHDPVLMQTYAANITKALISADPTGAKYYETRFKQYSSELNKLHQYAQQQFKQIPSAQRKVLTGHESFSYLGKRYGVKFIAPQGVSTEAQPSAKTVAAIIRQIKADNVKAVFTENIKDGRMVQRIAQETGVKVGGKLYSDALSRDAHAKSYADMFRYNIRVMTQAMK